MRNLNSKNLFLQHTQPMDIVKWVIGTANRPVIFTNFRPSSIALIHLVNSIQTEIPVIWIDSGFNTDATYSYVEKVVEELKLNLITYTPNMTARRWNAIHTDIPRIGNPLHEEFTALVKIEPFKRAMAELSPDYWFTGIRKDQTDFRSKLEVLSDGPNASLKVAPFLNMTADAVDQYIIDNGLPMYLDYFDPTKGPEHRECGLQLLA